MTDPILRHLEEELTRLRRLRELTLAILQRDDLTPDQRIAAIQQAFEGERDDEEDAEEARDRERLS